MHGTTRHDGAHHDTRATGEDWTLPGAEPDRRTERWLLAGALVLVLLAGGVGAAALSDDDAAGRDTVVQDAAGQPDQQPAAQVPDEQPAAQPQVADVVPAGTYGARVLGEGWDERGRYVVVDRGRLSDGPPAAPGVDGTRPVQFDTGAVAERRRIDLADGHDLRFARSGGEPSYGPGGWADLVTEISGRADPMLATIEVDPAGRLVSLVEPYRP